MTGPRHYQDLSRIYPLSKDAYDRLCLLVDRLRQWQGKTNLIAPSTLEAIWHRHVADSLQCLAIRPEARCWLDLGSGGGFPALVITAVMADFDDSEVVMIESIQKKSAFLRQTARQMGGRARVVTSRIEDYSAAEFMPDIVTARALTAMKHLLELSCPWLDKGATGLFHKGREYREELAECNGLWSFDLIHHTSRISSDSVILEMSNPRRKHG